MPQFDYLPGPDVEIKSWVEHFAAQLIAHQVELDVSAADLAEISGRVTAFVDALDENYRMHLAAKATRVAKDEARAACEAAIRLLVRRMQANPLVDDAEKKNLKITVRDTKPTRHAAPQSAPSVFIKEWFRGGHVLTIRDSESSGRAKPRGAVGAEVWVKIGDALVEQGGFQCLNITGRSTYRVGFDGDQAGQTAHYQVRWFNRHGERSPWSAIASGTITG
jgi:hypothetical protein